MTTDYVLPAVWCTSCYEGYDEDTLRAWVGDANAWTNLVALCPPLPVNYQRTAAADAAAQACKVHRS